jgi:hypothetical protein
MVSWQKNVKEEGPNSVKKSAGQEYKENGWKRGNCWRLTSEVEDESGRQRQASHDRFLAQNGPNEWSSLNIVDVFFGQEKRRGKGGEGRGIRI